MSNDLISLDDLAYLPGAPFTEEEVDDAVGALRGALGWHIAPEQEDTVVLDVVCGEPVLRLPTRHLVSVEEIRNASTSDVIAATVYKVSTKLNRVRRGSYWPSGYGAVEVDMTHGFETCPPELRPIIGQMITGSRGGIVKQETVGPFSRTFDSSGLSSDQFDTLERLSVRNSWPARL